MKNNRGYILVETIGTFVFFVFLNISILSLINIVAVQARIHYALTQAAETISMYSYTLEAIGVSDHIVNSAKRSNRVVEDSEKLVNNINGVVTAIEDLNWDGLQNSSKSTYNQVKGFAERTSDDPQDVLQDFMNFGLQKGSSYLFGELIRPLIGHYLENGVMSGDEYLKAFHIVDGLSGLEFYTADTIGVNSSGTRLTSGGKNDSMILDQNENLKIVVQYDIDYTFGALPLPFGKLHVTQEVITRAWLNGYGDGYVEK